MTDKTTANDALKAVSKRFIGAMAEIKLSKAGQNVNVVPQINITTDESVFKMTISFKIGLEKLYVVRDIYEFLDFCHQNGWFVVHAHPFRVRDYINLSIPPVTKGVDGIEVYNHCNKPDENAKALELCDQTGLIKVSGSDTHSDTLCGKAGLAFDKKITTPKALVKALKSGKGRLIINGEIL